MRGVGVIAVLSIKLFPQLSQKLALETRFLEHCLQKKLEPHFPQNFASSDAFGAEHLKQVSLN